MIAENPHYRPPEVRRNLTLIVTERAITDLQKEYRDHFPIDHDDIPVEFQKTLDALHLEDE